MVKPVSSTQSHPPQVSQPAVRRPQPPQQKPAEVTDKVTLKSVGGGDADHDGDSR